MFYIQRVKPHAITCPRQLPPRGGNTVSMAKAVLPSLVPPAAFATGQGIVLFRHVIRRLKTRQYKKTKKFLLSGWDRRVLHIDASDRFSKQAKSLYP